MWVRIPADLLADHFRDLDRLMEQVLKRYEAIKEIGPRIAESVVDFFDEEQNLEVIERLRAAGLNFGGGKKRS